MGDINTGFKSDTSLGSSPFYHFLVNSLKQSCFTAILGIVMVSLTEFLVVLYFQECPPRYSTGHYEAPVDEECSASIWVLQLLMKS